MRTEPKRRSAWWIACALILNPLVLAAETLHHDLNVRIDPERQQVAVDDLLTLPASSVADTASVLRFFLHPALTVQSLTPGARLSMVPGHGNDGTLAVAPEPALYALHLEAGTSSVHLRYEGRIHHPITDAPEDQARGVSGTPGIVSVDGVFLSGASHWYPVFGGEPVSFSMTVRSPADWDAVSQGERAVHQRDEHGTLTRWEETRPQPEIYLLAGRYAEYSRPVDVGKGITAMAFLRTPDETLASDYLAATERYLRMFAALLGPYPYAKFALVENFWESGYGMPSFTLLGSTVIRLPFIIGSSYPHEILHNWWGNGVYVDYGSGNWAEGLTAYLADHLLQEQRGTGADMRRGQLQRYADYVHEGRDFPLTAFRARHSPATEAVGYGKAMMFFHMLRRQLGDQAFLAGLRDFYHQHLFRVADFEDLRRALAAHADTDLRDEFRQWVQRSGAPRFGIEDAHSRALGGGRHELHVDLKQLQPGSPYAVRLPLAVTLEGVREAHEIEVVLRQPSQATRIELPARPLRVAVDPQFDVFRRLDRLEIPPALSQAFGAERVTVILPSAASRSLREQYNEVARRWQGASDDEAFRIVTDDQLGELPKDRAVWVFGWENRFLPAVRAALASAPVRFSEDRVLLPDQTLSREDHSAVLTARHPHDPALALTLLATSDPGVLPGLARRLPHYGSYSYLGFGGAEAKNLARGRWPVTDSPLSIAVRQSDGGVVDAPAPIYAPRMPLLAAPDPIRNN